MAYIDIWDETKPAGTRDANLGDDDIREFKRAIRERLQGGGMYFPSTDDADAGLHNYMNMIEQSSNPSSAANRGFLYTKDSGGVTELYYMDSAGTVVQLTVAGKMLLTSLGGWVARGDVIRGGASGWEKLALGVSGKVLKSDGTDAAWSDPNIAPRGTFRNINALPGADTSQWRVTADELVVADSSGNGALVQAFDKTLDMDTSGAGGVSTGAKAANTIYHVWAIRKSSDGTTNLVAAITSRTFAQVLSDVGNSYDQAALVSVIGLDNSSAIIPAKQYGDEYWFNSWALFASGNVGIAAWVSIGLTPANMTTVPGFVPAALSDVCFGVLGAGSGQTGILTNDSSVAVSTTAAPNKMWHTTGKYQFRINILTSDTLYWGSDNADSQVYIAGFKLNKIF